MWIKSEDNELLNISKASTIAYSDFSNTTVARIDNKLYKVANNNIINQIAAAIANHNIYMEVPRHEQ